MKYIILSDIHSNLQALEAVLESFPGEDTKEIVCAGDVIGYVANPNECIDMVISLRVTNILGNHDAAVIGKKDPTFFNEYAREAVSWTRRQVNRSRCDYLKKLPFVLENDLFGVVHGTLHEPEEFLYMRNDVDAMRTFEILKKQICFVGHSHVPGIFMCKNEALEQIKDVRVELHGDARYIINVGSVGQPRDHDNRACYCVYDTEKHIVEFVRIEYDVQRAREAILKAGLPGILGERLLLGR